MEEGKPINTTTQYPIDIYGATFYYEVSKNGDIKIYHNSWEEFKGFGNTVQTAIQDMVEKAKIAHPNYELIDDNLFNWMKKIRNLSNE